MVGSARTYLFYPGAEKAADEKFEALELRLDDDELEVRLGVHVPRLLLDELDLHKVKEDGRQSKQSVNAAFANQTRHPAPSTYFAPPPP